MKKMLAIGSLVVVMGISLAAVAASVGTDATYAGLGLLTEALDIVKRQYVDDVPTDKLMQDAIAGTLSDLDPDSVFVDAQHAQDWKRVGPAGIGLALTRKNDLITVIAPVDGSPAARAGIKAGDRIVKIDGLETRGLPLWQATRRLAGQPGTSVTLTVAREGWTDPRDLTIARKDAPPPTPSARELGNGLLYLRIPSLDTGTARDVERELARHPRESLAGIVLDVRDSPGGDPHAAAGVAGLFLGHDPRDTDAPIVVAQTRSRAPHQNGSLVATGTGAYRDVPLSVLVNRGTESVAEILAGALQDSRRATLVGVRTFGHAAIESIITLPDGALVRLETARYVTPAGRKIDGTGLTPDVTVEMPRADAASASAPSDTPAPDPQLRRAIDVLKIGRVVGAEKN